MADVGGRHAGAGGRAGFIPIDQRRDAIQDWITAIRDEAQCGAVAAVAAGDDCFDFSPTRANRRRT
jgi:hypothetical protein